MLFNSSYTTGNVFPPPLPHIQDEVYSTMCIPKWKPNLNSDFLYLEGSMDKLAWKVNMWGSSFADYNAGFDGYNYSEAMVLNNYIESYEMPYINPGVLYELNVEFSVDNVLIVYNAEGGREIIEKKAKDGDYDSLVPWQLLINNTEKYSNRPSLTGNNMRYDVTTQFTGTSPFHIRMNFKLKFQFKTEEGGLAKFRVLMPIFKNGSPVADDYANDWTNIAYGCVFFCEGLKLSVIDGLKESNDLIANRSINYTQQLTHSLDFSCTIDNSVYNSFGLGYPINEDYITEIDMDINTYPKWGYHMFAPGTALQLDYATWQGNSIIKELLFAKDKKRSCFLQTIDGIKSSFSSLWLHFNIPIVRVGYLTAYEGFPNIPEDYVAYTSVNSSDVLKCLDVKYSIERYLRRNDWVLFGSDVVDTYPRTIAKALFGVQSEQLFKLEADALELIYPDTLIGFEFNDEDKIFIPTTMNLDLFNGKTSFVATENKFVELTDISYE